MVVATHCRPPKRALEAAMERAEGDDEHGRPREACDERRNHLAREPRHREEQEDEEEPAGRVPIHGNLQGGRRTSNLTP